jgi:hypothetical protein
MGVNSRLDGVIYFINISPLLCLLALEFQTTDEVLHDDYS